MKDVSLWDRKSWKAVKESKGITHRQISEELGLYIGSVEKWFSGEKRPALIHQVALARILGIPLSQALENIIDPDVRELLRITL
ncbi:helix-turn-helix domain-containing protein [Streptomyces sp. NPDC047706]|uniref:helix-turn-helix domain-containing protein n=1 Tax=Streptomyces sp. NPDC047706 TaxID=3365486 RepID=UPI003711AB8D